MASRGSKFQKQLNTSRERLKSYTFQVDISLGSSVTKSLRKLGFRTDDHEDHFSRSADDVEWLAGLGKLQRSNRKKNFIVITKDKRMQQHPEELAAIRAAGLRHFSITSGKMTGFEIQDLIIKSIPEIADIVDSTEPPFIARITRAGIELMS